MINWVEFLLFLAFGFTYSVVVDLTTKLITEWSTFSIGVKIWLSTAILIIGIFLGFIFVFSTLYIKQHACN